MAIYTRFGREVEIRYRCDDFDIEREVGWVHVFDAQDQGVDTVPVWELRADGGINTIMEAALAAPVAHCTGQHPN